MKPVERIPGGNSGKSIPQLIQSFGRGFQKKYTVLCEVDTLVSTGE